MLLGDRERSQHEEHDSMRIYFDHQITSLQDSGGISRYYFELLRYLAGIPRLDVELAMGFNNSTLPFAEMCSEGARAWGWHNGIGPRAARYAFNEIVCSLARLGSEKIDIYHPTLYRCMPAVRAKRVVVTHHDCVYERFPGISNRTQQVINAKRKQFERADAIISVSESSKADLIRFYSVDPAKVTIIHHGVRPLHRDSSSERLLKRLVKDPFLLFVGSRASYKNFPALLQAFAQSGLSEDYRLLVIGGGPLSVAEAELCSNLGLLDRITVVARATDSLLAEAYARAYLLIYPSLYEGFGLPPLEAMTAGCPVLVGDTSSLPEVCGDAAFFFDVSDLNSLTLALIRAVRSDVERKAVALRGLERSAQFTWERSGQKTLALYQSL
jgi:glycosyltransferase involved in cell wall biosynthesis